MKKFIFMLIMFMSLAFTGFADNKNTEVQVNIPCNEIEVWPSSNDEVEAFWFPMDKSHQYLKECVDVIHKGDKIILKTNWDMTDYDYDIYNQAKGKLIILSKRPISLVSGKNIMIENVDTKVYNR